MLSKDRDYYRRRVEQEMAAARSSACAFARSVHLDLAERYTTKLRLIEAVGLGSAPLGAADNLSTG